MTAFQQSTSASGPTQVHLNQGDAGQLEDSGRPNKALWVSVFLASDDETKAVLIYTWKALISLTCS